MRWSLSGMTCPVMMILSTCATADAGELTSAEKAARDYSFHGVAIGTTRKDFIQQFPNARPHESDRPNVTAMYAPVGDKERFIIVEFYRDQVYYLGVTFSTAMLAEYGGREVLEQKLMEKLGYPNSVKGDMCYWRFPNVNRKVAYRQSPDGSSTLLVLDTAVDRQRREEQIRELDIGF